MRINKFVARATGMARRKADSMIESGQISVNGQPARIGQQINDEDEVMLGARHLRLPKYTYLMLNKPVGYVCSRHAQKGSKTVYDLLPSQYRSLKLVGRLDKDSSGLILLTDDGDFAHKMLHPSKGKSKVYEVKLDKQITDEAISQLNQGVQLEDGLSLLEVVRIDDFNLRVEMSEGRNRQIRRSFGLFGLEVTCLDRVALDDYSIENLGRGDYQTINPG